MRGILVVLLVFCCAAVCSAQDVVDVYTFTDGGGVVQVTCPGGVCPPCPNGRCLPCPNGVCPKTWRLEYDQTRLSHALNVVLPSAPKVYAQRWRLR